MSGALTLGCVALRPIDGQRGEMKRLYVRPGARGQRLGSALAQAICAEARRAGYREICLDTLASMTTAVALYRSLGFREIEPYLFNPLPGALYFGLALD
jgi:ribosomal protein S18 acetylase RimI-like enzyme